MKRLGWKFKRFIHRLKVRIGRRGATLFFFALLLGLVGQSYVSRSITDTAALRLLEQLMPAEAWGVLWLGGSVSCIAGGISKQYQPIAFTIATYLMVLWATISMTTWVLSITVTGWIGALIYGALAALVYMISGWRENDGS